MLSEHERAIRASDTRADALSRASLIANLLVDPQRAWDRFESHRSEPRKRTGSQRPQALAGGAAGTALLHIERAHAGHRDWATARAWLSAAAAEDISAASNANLYFGAPALGFITHAATATGDLARGYPTALAQLDACTVALTRQRLDAAHARISSGERPPLAEFDLIRGLTGFGTYHLTWHPDHDITRDVLDYFVRLTRPLPGDDLPGWWTDVAPNGEPTADLPGGHGNLGMSHGIAAPLSLLSLAHQQGIVVPGHIEAIERICAWLDTWQQPHPSGPWWPGWVSLDHARRGSVPDSSRQRPSWCYGTPGLARAQQLAALALGDTDRQHTAEIAMLGCLRDRDQYEQLTGHGLCHGVAGMLQVAWRMAAHSPEIAAELPGAGDGLLGANDPYGTPELLDGTAGAALAFHTLGTDTAPVTRWDSCLLLA